MRLQYVVRVPDQEEARVGQYAASHYGVPMSLDSAVDDLIEEEFEAGWWDGFEFEIADYGFWMVT